jgi:hypothetical protein
MMTGAVAMLLLAGCGGRTPSAAEPLPVDEATATSAIDEAAEVAPAVTSSPAATSSPAVTPAPAGAPAPEDATRAAAAPARAAAENEIFVDASASQGSVNPLAHGVTWGPLWPVSAQMMPLVEELAIGVISFPGGEYGDTTDLQEIEIDRFIELCRTLGAEPLIHVRLPGGTPEKAVALLEYANKEKGYGVKYWAIGNEPNLYPGKYTETPWDPAYFAAEWRRFAEAMEAADPSIQLVGPEVTQFAGTTGVTRSDERDAIEWVRTFLEVNGDLVDYVSIHRYPFPRDIRSTTTIDELMANPPEWDERILPDLKALMVETIGRELPIAVTEINSHWNRAQRQEASPDTVANAVWWGDVFMRMLREGVDMVAFWSLNSRDDQGAWGIVGKYGERPTYHTFALYSRFGTDLVHASVGGEAAASVGALSAFREDGALTVMLTNRSAAAQTVSLAVENLPAAAASAQPVELWRLDADNPGVLDAGALPALGESIMLPAHSLTLLVLK